MYIETGRIVEHYRDNVRYVYAEDVWDHARSWVAAGNLPGYDIKGVGSVAPF